MDDKRDQARVERRFVAGFYREKSIRQCLGAVATLVDAMSTAIASVTKDMPGGSRFVDTDNGLRFVYTLDGGDGRRLHHFSVSRCPYLPVQYACFLVQLIADASLLGVPAAVRVGLRVFVVEGSPSPTSIYHAIWNAEEPRRVVQGVTRSDWESDCSTAFMRTLMAARALRDPFERALRSPDTWTRLT